MTDATDVVAAAVVPLLQEHQELQDRLADPAIHADPGLARRIGRRHAELSVVVDRCQLPDPIQ